MEKDGAVDADGSRILKGFLVVALALGAWARLTSLGAASLAVDEYYLIEAVNNILRSGLPEWICGGFYTRGLVHQYWSAALVASGMFSREVALRLPSVVSGCAVVVGAYLLARRLGGKNVAMVVAGILSLSLWEVEYARFGRMYALFQAITVFYALAALRYLTEGRPADLWWMLGLSAVAVLSHEGGIFLVAFSVIALAIRPRKASLLQWSVGTAILIGAAWFLVTDFRFMGVENPYSDALLATTPESDGGGPLDLPELPAFHAGLQVMLLLSGLATGILLAIPYARNAALSAFERALACLTLLAVSITLAMQLYLLAALVLSCAVALQILDFSILRRRDFVVRAAAGWILLIVAGLVAASLNGKIAGGEASGVVDLLKSGLRYPDLLLKAWLPWRGVLPVLGISILFVSATATLLVLAAGQRLAQHRSYVTLSGITLTLLVGATLASQPYYATRYTFFLYPLFVVLLVQGCVVLGRIATTERISKAITTVLFGLLGAIFLTSADFNLKHLLNIDSPEYLYRIDYGIEEQEHLNRRWDFRSVGEAINTGARAEDLVISTVYPVLPYYSSLIDIAYLDRSSQRIWAVSACSGERDLWSNLPLRFEPQDLRDMVRNAGIPVWIALMTDRHPAQTAIEAELLSAYGANEVFRSIDGYVALLRIP